MTPFARLLLFLVIFLPLAYFGAAYYNGEDGLGNVKRLLGWDTPTEQVGEVVPNESEASTAAAPAAETEADYVRLLREENERLRRELADREAEIERLRAQVQQ